MTSTSPVRLPPSPELPSPSSASSPLPPPPLSVTPENETNQQSSDSRRRHFKILLPINFADETISASKRSLRRYARALSCPIMDRNSLLFLSIFLLILERFVTKCLVTLEEHLNEMNVRLEAAKNQQGQTDLVMLYDDELIDKLSIGIGISTFIFLILSVVLNSASVFAVGRSQLPDVFSMLGLFCFDSIQMITVLILIGQTTAISGNDKLQSTIILLLGIWVGSMVGSQVLRRQLYRRLSS